MSILNIGSVADPGCLSRIRIFPSRILGHKVTGSLVIKSLDPDPQQRISVFLTQKIETKLSEI
jgi:hypothetical protein